MPFNVFSGAFLFKHSQASSNANIMDTAGELVSPPSFSHVNKVKIELVRFRFLNDFPCLITDSHQGESRRQMSDFWEPATTMSILPLSIFISIPARALTVSTTSNTSFSLTTFAIASRSFCTPVKSHYEW